MESLNYEQPGFFLATFLPPNIGGKNLSNWVFLASNWGFSLKSHT